HIEIEKAPGASAATLGLEEEEAARGPASRSPELSLACRAKSPARGKKGRAPRVGLWAVVAALLAAAAITVPQVSLFWRLPDLERRLEETRRLRASLPQLDNELAFFENLDASQVHYLDALAALAGAAPPGTILESLSMNRQGEVSLQGTALGTQAPNVLRGKLAVSGWFSHVVLEEQGPKDDKHVTFRLRAHMKTSSPRGGSQ
ncbi:MAG TPA: PilN domain-containing protein, partial [Planctomycetota bacterium]|nr:PilN domain-containing protein [Planctomycetota bacterium]